MKKKKVEKTFIYNIPSEWLIAVRVTPDKIPLYHIYKLPYSELDYMIKSLKKFKEKNEKEL